MNPAIPRRAWRLAPQLELRFEPDCELATQLDDAPKRLRRVKDRLCTGLHPDGIAPIYAEHPAAAQIAVAHSRSVPDPLRKTEEAHRTVPRALIDDQSAGERQRQLVAAGWSQHNARGASVRELACAAGQRGSGS